MCRRERRDTPESEGDLLQIGSRVNGRPFEYLSLLDTVMRKEKRIQKTERGISERWNNFKWPNIKVTEVSEGKDRKKIG